MKMCIPFVPRAWVNGQFDRKKKLYLHGEQIFSPVKARGFSLSVQRWCDFQCRGVLLIWTVVGQGPTALAVGAGGVVWTFFLSCIISLFLFPSLWEMARYRLKYCLKGPLSPKQPTNHQPRQPFHSMFYTITIGMKSDKKQYILIRSLTLPWQRI